MGLVNSYQRIELINLNKVMGLIKLIHYSILTLADVQ